MELFLVGGGLVLAERFLSQMKNKNNPQYAYLYNQSNSSYPEEFVSNFPESRLPTAETPFKEVELVDIPELKDDEVLEIDGKVGSESTREGYRELRNIGVPQRFYYVDDEIFVRENGLIQHPTYPTFKKEPWFPRDYDYQSTLDLFTGNNLKPMLDRPQKKENPPLYKPWKDPNIPNRNYVMNYVLNQSHRWRDETSPRSRAFETPTEPIRVPPGLNKGYTAEPDNRPFHPWFRAEPKTIDELRGYNRPSYAIERTTPGWASGSQMRSNDRRVDPKRKEAVYGLDERRILPQLGSFRKPSKYGDTYLITPPRINKEVEYFGNKDVQNVHMVNRPETGWEPTRGQTHESFGEGFDGNDFEGRNLEFPVSSKQEHGEFVQSRANERKQMANLDEEDLARFVEGRINAEYLRHNQSKRTPGTRIEHPYKQDRREQVRYAIHGYSEAQINAGQYVNPDAVKGSLLNKTSKRIAYQDRGAKGRHDADVGLVGKGSHNHRENLMLKAPKSYEIPLSLEDQGVYQLGRGSYDNYAMKHQIESLKDQRRPKANQYTDKIRKDGTRGAMGDLQQSGYNLKNVDLRRTNRQDTIAISQFGNGGSNRKGLSNRREHMGIPAGMVPKKLIVGNDTRPPTCCKPKKTLCDYDLYGRQTKTKSNRLAKDPGPMPVSRDNPYNFINRAPAQTVVKPKAELNGALALDERTFYKPFEPPLKAKKANFL